MVSSAFKPVVNGVIEPIAKAAIKARVTPDAVTIVGTVGSIASSIFFITSGRLFLASLVITAFMLSDLFDGAIARLSERGPSQWGAFLDSTCDRISDAALLGSLAIYCILEEIDLYPLVIASLVLGFLVSYIRAKSESYGVACTVGIAERTERLIITLIAVGLEGLSLPYALTAGMWLLFILSAITVLQRFFVVRKGLAIRD
jgi:CDP-diacylglycerol--glycerol-3-phosphate 3-phosphatidyltransferase